MALLVLVLIARLLAAFGAARPPAGFAPPAQPDARYELRIEPAPVPRVVVELTVSGDSDGLTTLVLQPSWGPGKNDGRDVSGLAALGRALRPLNFRRTAPTTWEVTHDPGEPLQISYSIPASAPGEDADDRGNDYRTRLTPSFFQMIGNLGLLIPEHLLGPDEHDFQVRWHGSTELGWTVASSFGPGLGPHVVRTTGDRLRHAVFIAGEGDALRLHTRELAGSTIGVAIADASVLTPGAPASWGFEDEALVDLALEIIRAERDFFSDHSDPWFLITLTPEGAARAGSFSIGGTGLTNAFSLYCNTGLSLEPDSPFASRLALLLAHEYFHTWNGGKIPSSDEQGAGYWVSEGLTNFYARRILHRAGLLDDAGALDNLNEAVAAYDANPFRNAPASRITEEFWTNFDIGQLPYQRGELVALAVDERIREASGGARSLDDLMRDLLARSASGEPYSSRAVLDLIARETDPGFAATIRRVVEDGEDVALPARLSEPQARLDARAYVPR